MKHIILAALCSISVLASCNLKPITYSVTMSSNTLKIDNAVATKNRDYEGTISLIDTDDDYCLPTLIIVTIADKTLEDKEYVYDFNTGKIFISADFVVGNIFIVGERSEIDAYKANFVCDEHVRVFIYKSRDYSVEPIESNAASSRDGDTGRKVKDGTGEINFKVEIDENYDINMLWVKGLYDKCQDEVKTKNDDTYRVTKIRSDLQVKITTRKIYCKNLKASDDLNRHSFSFSWSIRKSDDVKQVNVDIITKNGEQHDIAQSKYEYLFDNAMPNEMYTFKFSVMLNNGTICEPISITRFIGQKENVDGIPRIEIETENKLIPEVKQPVTNYVQNIIKIYNTSNVLIYDSSKNEDIGEEYKGSKIKIRGNATANFRKKPYKVKLKNNADLLESFRSVSDSAIDYTHKEWLLLAPNINNAWFKTLEDSQLLYTPIGFTVANALDFDWKPAYQFVTLYLNNDYQGIYILCETTSRGNGAGETQSRYKIDKDGYIIEKDCYWQNEDIYIKTPIEGNPSSCFTFKYPDTDDFNKESDIYEYIKNYTTTLENKILNLDTTCFEMIDKSSLTRWLLGHDILANEDARGSNIFLYKKDSTNNTILKMGTIWDFGLSLKNPNSLAKVRATDNFYYMYFLQIAGFEQEVKNLWDAKKDIVKSAIDSCINSFDDTLYNKLLEVESKRGEFEKIPINQQKNTMQTFFATHYSYLDNSL